MTVLLTKVTLRIFREKAGMSPQELADIAEVSKMTIQRIENAKYLYLTVHPLTGQHENEIVTFPLFIVVVKRR